MEVEKPTEEEQQQEQQQHVLTLETTKDLIELLGDKKPEVQKGALNIILQFTNTVAHRKMFL